MVGLAGLLHGQNGPRAPHFPAKAKRVIFLFMHGGPSHLDTFDPKPRLIQDHGKPLAVGVPAARPKRDSHQQPVSASRHARR